MNRFAIVLLFVLLMQLTAVPLVAYAQSSDAVAKRQAELQAELEATQKDIDYWSKLVSDAQKQGASLSRDVALLTAKIAEAKAIVKAKNIAIQQLGRDINEKSSTISKLDAKINRQLESLAGLIRKANVVEAYSLSEYALSGRNLSEFFGELDEVRSFNEAMQSSFRELKATRAEVESEKEALAKRQAAELDARKVIEAEQRQIQKNEGQKKELLSISKTQEKTYKGILSERERRAAQIRSALFALRDTAAIPFGTAYNYAFETQKKTGVRPAFLLAILTQETNLGENVGQCLVTNFETGDGVGKNTGAPFFGIMKPDRDIKPFLSLSERLGFDPRAKPISCPQRGSYGGAMGPSQFIPSTWASYERRISNATGVSIPDPWIPRDAFFASSLYLADLGADAGGYSAEHTAAAKYYAGGAWRTRGQSYANSVMKIAQNIQENMIDPLQNL